MNAPASGAFSFLVRERPERFAGSHVVPIFVQRPALRAARDSRAIRVRTHHNGVQIPPAGRLCSFSNARADGLSRRDS